MGATISKSTLFPLQLQTEMINLVRGKSSIARLAGGNPIPFNGSTVFTFNFDSEVDVVAENGAKSNGGGSVAPVTIQPVKIEYGFRTSDEFMYAAEEYQLQVMRAFAEGFANKAARGLDIMAFHGLNPRTGSASAVIGNNHLDYVVTNIAQYDAADPVGNISAAVGLVEAAEHEVTGMAMAPAFRSALAGLKKGTGSNELIFPELAFGGTPDSIYGLACDTNSTVSFSSGLDRAIIGNFRDFFKWGYAKEIPVEIIEYGDPDNSGSDLKGHNQIYIRGELYLGWGIMVPAAFARVAQSTISLNKSTTTIANGANETLTATVFPTGAAVEWSSSDETKATVDDSGKVVGVAAGTAVITASVVGASATCTVTVS